MKENNTDKSFKEIEDVLYERKLEIDQLSAPENLEYRLKKALAGREFPTTRRFLQRNKRLIAALITLALVFSYSYDTLAYYGKRMIGYDEIVYGSVAVLNEEGAGQEINKSYTFSNGVKVTLDGIMFDENELVAFYKLESTNSKLEDINFFMEMDGINPFNYQAAGGAGSMIDDYTQIWVHSFHAPKFYEKWLILEITMNADRKSEMGKINFTLDRSKAIKRTAKQEIGKEIEIEGLKVKFLSLTASRLNTTIEGFMEPIPGMSIDTSEYSFENHPHLSFDIFVDDKYYASAYAGVNYLNRTEFCSEALGLPAEFKSIDIKNIRLVREKMVDKTTAITVETKNLLLAEDLLVKEVYPDGDEICVNVMSKGIPIMGLEIAGEQVKGKNDQYSVLRESSVPVERIYRFQNASKGSAKGEGQNRAQGQGEDKESGSGTSTEPGSDMKLMVKVINYSRYSGDSISIIPQ